MRVVLQYRSGDVPDDQVEAEVEALWAWVGRLSTRSEHGTTVVLDVGGLTVDRNGSTPYAGDAFAFSIIEVDSLDVARALVRDWPEFAFGGHIDIRQELTR